MCKVDQGHQARKLREQDMRKTILITAVGMALASAATGTAATVGVWGPVRLTASAKHQATEIAALQRQVALLERAVPVAGTCRAYRLPLGQLHVQAQVISTSGWSAPQTLPVLSTYTPNPLPAAQVVAVRPGC